MRSPSYSLLMLGLAFLAGCQGAQQTNSMNSSSSTAGDAVAAGAVGDERVATMWIHGMACPQCSYNVDLQLMKVPGVQKVKVDMSSGKVQAWLSPANPPTREQLAKAVEQTTFTLVRLDMPASVQ